MKTYLVVWLIVTYVFVLLPSAWRSGTESVRLKSLGRNAWQQHLTENHYMRMFAPLLILWYLVLFFVMPV